MKSFNINQLLNAFQTKGYELKSKPFEINIFGIRNSDTTADTFDDVVGLLYRTDKGVWVLYQYQSTTDPGSFYRSKPINVNGTIIMVPMQHKNCYKIGKHHDYKAMQQIAPMAYVRDNNKDKVLDFLYKIVGFKSYREVAATNIHHASNTGKSINNYNWSAGCQVIADINDFNEFMTKIENSVNINGYANLFDYTLFEVEDIK